MGSERGLRGEEKRGGGTRKEAGEEEGCGRDMSGEAHLLMLGPPTIMLPKPLSISMYLPKRDCPRPHHGQDPSSQYMETQCEQSVMVPWA